MSRFYASTESDPSGQDTVTSREGGFPHTVQVSHWVREYGAGAPIPSAGGQRDSRRVAGPFVTHAEATAEADRRNAAGG